MTETMFQTSTRCGPRSTEPTRGPPVEQDWGSRLMILRGLCEEYQSSVIALPQLLAAARRTPQLAATLRAPLAEMQHSQQALRREVLLTLAQLARLVGNSRADLSDGR